MNNTILMKRHSFTGKLISIVLSVSLFHHLHRLWSPVTWSHVGTFEFHTLKSDLLELTFFC